MVLPPHCLYLPSTYCLDVDDSLMLAKPHVSISIITTTSFTIRSSILKRTCIHEKRYDTYSTVLCLRPGRNGAWVWMKAGLGVQC